MTGIHYSVDIRIAAVPGLRDALEQDEGLRVLADVIRQEEDAAERLQQIRVAKEDAIHALTAKESGVRSYGRVARVLELTAVSAQTLSAIRSRSRERMAGETPEPGRLRDLVREHLGEVR